MVGLTELRDNALMMRKLAEGGQQSVEMKVVLAFLTEPLLALKSLEETGEPDWLTCSEYMEIAECNRNYLEKGLQRYGGKNRLQHWRSEGPARRSTIWRIHRAALPQSKGGRMEEVRRRPGEPDSEALTGAQEKGCGSTRGKAAPQRQAPAGTEETGSGSRHREPAQEVLEPAAGQETGLVPSTPSGESIYNQINNKKGKTS
jgi:hypothetical protein